MKTPTRQSFQKIIYDYYKTHGRHDLPWRKTDNPYYILISEIMLQQTQVDRVLPKYEQFVTQFPTIEKLSEAPLRDVLKNWQGLGYNSRARNLQKAVQIIHTNYKDQIPDTQELLLELPGIGPYTTSALQTFVFNKPVVVIETNIRTVYFHFFFEDQTNIKDQELIPVIEKTMDKQNPRDWYYALMDYGVYLKKTVGNLNKKSRTYTKQSTFQGSKRQIRGKIIKLLTIHDSLSYQELKKQIGETPHNLTQIIEELKQENLIHQNKKTISIA